MTLTLPAVPDPRPELPYGIVWAMGSWADGDTSDPGRAPNAHPLDGVLVEFELSHHVLVTSLQGHQEIRLKRKVKARFDHRGILQRLPDAGDPEFVVPPSEMGVPLLPTNSPSVLYVGPGTPLWTVRAADPSGFPTLTFALGEGEVLDLADVIAEGAAAGDGQLALYHNLLTAATELRDAMVAGATGIESIEQTGPNTVDFVMVGGTRFPVTIPGQPGQPGQSAYQLAVDLGFVGTEAQWLASLRGDPAPLPEVSWSGPRLTVDGQTSQDLSGPAGPPNTLSIGDVESGTVAGASITGTAPNQALHLTLPRGDDARPRYTALTAVSAGRTVTEADEGALLEVTSATPVTITLPTSFPLGGVVDVVQAGEGSVTLAGTVLCSGQPVTRAQGSVVTCVKRAAGWLVAGDVVT